MGKTKEAVKKGAVLGLSALAALQLAKAPKAFSMDVGSLSGIAKEAKPFKVADAKEITIEFEKAWAEIRAKYGGKMGDIPLPGRVTFKPLKQDRYLSELMVEGGDGAFSIGSESFILKAVSKNSIFVSYPESLKVSESQMHEFAMFVYLSVAVDGYSYNDRLLFPGESIPYLFLETLKKGSLKECGPIYATVGFVAYAVDPENPFELIRLLSKDDVDSVKMAVDSVCGDGFWDEVRHVSEGGPLLNAIMNSVLKKPDGAKTIDGYLKFMEKNFNADASRNFTR